jgi:hypothetical protein
MGAGQAKLYAMSEEEGTQSIVVKFASIISLQGQPWEPKLCGDIGAERLKQRKNIRLIA